MLVHSCVQGANVQDRVHFGAVDQIFTYQETRLHVFSKSDTDHAVKEVQTYRVALLLMQVANGPCRMKLMLQDNDGHSCSSLHCLLAGGFSSS